MRRLLQFLKEARLELKKVSWPTRKELVSSTTLVIVVSVLFGVFLGILDLLFFQSVYGLIAMFGG
ncbi:preprotein translocase subunit SecE [Candidatus Vecturithrix granuli]|uniref:Protein translocase subunit SecE n=1 Tax=Vecturithrix granuli TaxID=1499967 RepID=A0A081C334_VECG1|nr:preprotein translocase subunit SecE [Candidatus Vecturithrix granuli]